MDLLPPVMEKTWAVYSAGVGDRSTLPCPVRNKGSQVIMWMKNEKVLTQDEVSLLPNFEVNADHSLVIKKVTVEDSGDYTCKLVPSGLLSSSHLNVKHAPGVRVTDGLRDITDRTLTFREGEKIRLHCEVQGYPVPTSHWETKHHRLADLAGVIRNKGELIIESAEAHHSGIYICTAQNEEEQSAQGSVHVVIECESPATSPELVPD